MNILEKSKSNTESFQQTPAAAARDKRAHAISSRGVKTGLEFAETDF